MRLDWCLTWRKRCGKPAADYSCQRRGFRTARAFVIAKDIGHTKIMKTGQVCKYPKCDGLTYLVCD